MRLAADVEAAEQRTGMEQAAFIGWQVACVMLGSEAVGPLDAYLGRFGLGASEPVQTATTEEALANAQRTLEYFRTHPRRVEGRGKHRTMREQRKRRRRGQHA